MNAIVRLLCRLVSELFMSRNNAGVVPVDGTAKSQDRVTRGLRPWTSTKGKRTKRKILGETKADDDAPVDGSAWLSGKCDLRVIRGGSWNNKPWYVRSAYRFGLNPDFRNSVSQALLLPFSRVRTVGAGHGP